MDPLFPPVPEDITALSDDELATLRQDHLDARDLIVAEDEEFLAGREADDVLAELGRGADQLDAIVAEQKARVEAHESYEDKKAALAARFDEPTVDDDPGDETEKEEGAEAVVAEAEAITAETEEPKPDDEGDEDNGDEEKVEERELVVASAADPVRLRRPPAPSVARQVPEPIPTGTALVAAGEMSLQFKDPLTPTDAGRGRPQGRNPSRACPEAGQAGDVQVRRPGAQDRQGRVLVPGRVDAHGRPADGPGEDRGGRRRRHSRRRRQVLAHRFRRHLRSGGAVLLDAELRHRGRARLGLPSRCSRRAVVA